MEEFLWELEVFILIGGIIAAFFYIKNWYAPLTHIWPKEGREATLFVLGISPIISLIIILVVLLTLAAPDVVNDPFYILFYTVMGIPLLLCHIVSMQFLDISWREDLLNLNNSAALLPVTGGLISASIMYAAMNIGDGDGWWCVLIPYIMCWSLWFLLAAFLCVFAKVSERITINRNRGCGIRFGVYLIVSSIVIAKANVGDWTSFAATVYEFTACWLVALLTLSAFVVEIMYMALEGNNMFEPDGTQIASSFVVSALYIIIGVCLWFLMPSLPINSLR